MTTARERYEAKTRVVTFRVSRELYDELEKTRTQSKLSFADMIKLGAGIAQDEVRAKLGESANLKGRLRELRQTIEAERKSLSEIIKKERTERLAKLAKEIQVLRLFDLGWSIQEVSNKLGITDKESYDRFKEWGKLRNEKQATKDELVRRCLGHHIYWLQEQIAFHAVGKNLIEAKQQLAHCWSLQNDLSRLSVEERTFLLSEYSRFV